MGADLLAGKVIVVTGAGGGVGRGIALESAAQGAKVVVNDLGGDVKGEGADTTPAQNVVKEINDAGGEAVVSGHNVADWDQAHEIIQTAIDNFGRIDGVVNNAGILRDGIFHKMDEAQFDSVVAVHLKGSFNVARAAAPHFKAQESGAFVHMTSTSGLIGNFGQVNYCAAKLGIAGMSKAISLDMQRFNVRSNCIAPFAWTRMVGTIPAKEEDGDRLEKLKQLKPECIAPFACGLMADGAADVSGNIFGVRANEIFLFSQPRPIRSAHAGDGWTTETVLERALPMFRPSLYPLDRSMDIFSWDPV